VSAQKTLAAEGVGGLYKGVAAPLTGQMFFRFAPEERYACIANGPRAAVACTGACALR